MSLYITDPPRFMITVLFFDAENIFCFGQIHYGLFFKFNLSRTVCFFYKVITLKLNKKLSREAVRHI